MPPPLRFFEDSEKTAARSAAVFSVPAYNLITHILKKKSTSWEVRSGHQARSKSRGAKKAVFQLRDRAMTTVIEGSI